MVLRDRGHNTQKRISLMTSGMMTGVGLDSPSSCAAVRCKISNSVETGFKGDDQEPIVGTYVPLDKSYRGRAKVLQMIVSPIRECLDILNDPDTRQIALLLCVAEQSRPGRIQGLDDLLLDEIQTHLSMRLSPESTVISHGRVGGVMALRQAMQLIHHGQACYCIVAGVDTYMIGGTLSAYDVKSRLLTEENSNGFIPAEAGAAVLLGPETPEMKNTMTIQGIGFGQEAAHIESEDPLRANAMVEAIRQALHDAGCKMEDLDYRITDANGEQYPFKEAALALTRILRKRKPRFDIWNPAASVGEIGSAFVPLSLGIALAAARKNYAPGNNVLCHFGNDTGERGAIIMSYLKNGGE